MCYTINHCDSHGGIRTIEGWKNMNREKLSEVKYTLGQWSWRMAYFAGSAVKYCLDVIVLCWLFVKFQRSGVQLPTIEQAQQNPNEAIATFFGQTPKNSIAAYVIIVGVMASFWLYKPRAAKLIGDRRGLMVLRAQYFTGAGLFLLGAYMLLERNPVSLTIGYGVLYVCCISLVAGYESNAKLKARNNGLGFSMPHLRMPHVSLPSLLHRRKMDDKDFIEVPRARAPEGSRVQPQPAAKLDELMSRTQQHKPATDDAAGQEVVFAS